MLLVMHIGNRYLRALWVFFAVIVLISAVMPIPHMTTLLHYGVYTPLKLACFLSLGYLTPLGFVRINASSRGMVFAALSAATLEVLQGFIGNGHSFHLYELAVKWMIIAVGFMFGLDARCEGALDIGVLRLTLARYTPTRA